MHSTVAAIIERYRLEPLPVEGTLFASTYRSQAETPDGGPVGTAMIGLYAHEPLSRSLFHRLPTDEVWHFYLGDPIRLVLLHPDGRDETIVLGTDLAGGQTPFSVVPAGSWMGARLDSGEWAVFGCTMSPGFAPSDFEGAEPEALIQRWPQRADDVLAMTRSGHPRSYEGGRSLR